MNSVPDAPTAADWSTDASLANASSRPTNRALVYEGAIRGIVHNGSCPALACLTAAGDRTHQQGALGYAARVTDGRRAPHPANELNELTGEEWLYFTKSVLTTAYPSELGHAARKAHGANKPPRLMARLIEFFSRTGELVLDPFAGVGGTLLGAAIARRPRRALGIELDPRWAAIYT
jgi:hypothetical protein